MVEGIRLVEKALGKVNYDIAPSAMSSMRGRRSLYVSSDIKAGEIITDTNIKSVRPSFGLHPKYFKQILGKRVKRDLYTGDRLDLDSIE
jgi:sialic acid synthase SpsE